MSYMVDIFNRLGPDPAPTPAPPSASEGAFGGMMGNFAPPAPQASNPQGAFGGLMSNINPPAQWASTMPAPQAMQGQAPMLPPSRSVAGVMPAPQGGGMGRVGYRTANGDTGLQGANMPQPQRPSWLDGLMGGITSTMPKEIDPMSYGNDNAWLLPSTPQQGGGVSQMPAFQAPQQPMSGMFGVTRVAPQSGPMSYGGMGFGGGAPQGNPMQMPSAPFQSGMRAGSVGNQMGGLNNMYSNFAAPSPMPAPPPPMFGAPAGNSRAMMGPKPVGLF